MSISGIKNLFLVAALYDLVLGLVFGLFYEPIYTRFGTALPNHAGYIQLAAAFIFIFGIGFYLVFRNPKANQGIITLGILMKVAFAVIVFGHLAFDSVPSFYIPFAVLDVVFMILFLWAGTSLRKSAGGRLPST